MLEKVYPLSVIEEIFVDNDETPKQMERSNGL